MPLKRVLTAVDAAWIVAGSMIGAGIFITPGIVAARLEGAAWILGAWLLGGLISLAGALVYGELGARLPEAGGDYRYMAEAYGPLWGFVNGWAAITLTFSAAAAAQARSAMTYLLAALPGEDGPLSLALAAPAAVLALTWANVRGARVAGRTTALLTAGPLVVLFGLFAAGALAEGAELHWPEHALAPPAGPWAVALGAAIVPIFFTYSGWNAAAYLGGEVRDAGRGLARGLVAGTALVTVVYAAVNVLLIALLPPEVLAGSERPAGDAAARLLGPFGEALLAGTIAVAILGSATVTLMAGARVYYAMALDGLAPAPLQRVSAAGVPSAALWMGGIWSALLAAFGEVGTLVDWATLAILLLSSMTVAALFVLRRRARSAAAAFRCPLYPVTPLLYLAVSLGAAVASCLFAPRSAAAGLAIVAAGLPLFALFRRWFRTG